MERFILSYIQWSNDEFSVKSILSLNSISCLKWARLVYVAFFSLKVQCSQKRCIKKVGVEVDGHFISFFSLSLSSLKGRISNTPKFQTEKWGRGKWDICKINGDVTWSGRPLWHDSWRHLGVLCCFATMYGYNIMKNAKSSNIGTRKHSNKIKSFRLPSEQNTKNQNKQREWCC